MRPCWFQLQSIPQSEWLDSNQQHLGSKPSRLPNCPTLRNSLGRSRTYTEQFLRLPPLPIGLRGQNEMGRNRTYRVFRHWVTASLVHPYQPFQTCRRAKSTENYVLCQPQTGPTCQHSPKHAAFGELTIVIIPAQRPRGSLASIVTEDTSPAMY